MHPALTPMTTETRMRVTVRDGWPFYQPRVVVKGLPLGRHRNQEGDVCLWDVGDSSFEWRTWDGISKRIEEWASGAQGNPTEDDPGLDPHRTFVGPYLGLATIDLTYRPLHNWDNRSINATKQEWGLEIGEGDEVGWWFVLDRPKEPPQTVDQLRAQLRKRQRRDLDAALADPAVTFLAFAWNTPAGANLLILGISRNAETGMRVIGVYEAAREDSETRRLRAGPDAQLIEPCVAILFGAGAIGSHVGVLLARTGVGRLGVIDGDTLRPGDLVRHRVSGLNVGRNKAKAVRLSNFIEAPWTRTVATDTASWDPVTLKAAIHGADLVIDAVGAVGFTAQLSRICAAVEVAMLSVALYRGGAVGRVRIQAKQPAVQIADRGKDDRFLKIPPSAVEEHVAWEAGCASPVVQAPPISVAAIGASASRIAVDVLAGRETGDLDFLECYGALPEAPFDEPGIWRCRP